MIFEETRVLVKTENLCMSNKLGSEMQEAIKSADMRIMQGEFVIIEGLYGIQKNVFFNIMGCLEKPTAGKYYFDYEDITLARAEMLDFIRKLKLGYLFRDFKLIARMTAAENIEIPMHGLNISKKEKHDRLQRALRIFDIESVAEEKASNLSNLQKQLVSIARAVVNAPLMIIADEPAANLNGIEEQKIMEHLLRLNSEGITIMLITEKTAAKVLNNFRLISFKDGKIYGDSNERNLSLVRKEA